MTDETGLAQDAGPSSRQEQLVLFAAEVAEDLDAADHLLLAAEREPGRGDHLQALDDTFAGFAARTGALGLEGVAPLTRAAHALVRACRDRVRKLEGPGFDALYETVACLRAYLDELYVHLDAGTPLPDGTDAQPTLERLLVLRAGGAVDEAPLPETRAGQRIGDILVSPPLDVPAAVIERGLEAQLKSGRRLGEELIASHLVEASVVARALRAQARHGADGHGHASSTTRVEQGRLDTLMEAIGELVVVESTLKNVPEFRNVAGDAARRVLAQLAKVARELADAGNRLRLEHAHDLFQRVSRSARELARKGGKQVRIVTHGDATELDRVLVEQLAEPLLAVVRIALAHSLEDREARERAGKPARGTVRLGARAEAGHVVVEVTDDGAGVDPAALAARLPGASVPADAAALEALLFTPGLWPPAGDPDGGGPLPTLDLLRRRLEALRGRLHVGSTPGAGLSFRIVLPLTLTTVDAMLVACGRERFLVPTMSVVESIRPEPHMVVTQAGRTELLSMRGRVMPLLRLGRLLDIGDARQDPGEALVMVLEAEERRFGLLVDDVIAQQRVVVKSLGDGIDRVELFGGAGIHGAGQIGLILNVGALLPAAA